MSAVAANREQRMSGLAALAALCAALFIAPEATEPVVLGVALLAAAVVALMFFPLRYPSLAITALVLAVDNPLENPAGGKWDSPLRPLGELLYQNLNASVGLEALHLSLLDVLIVALLAVTLLRGDRGAPGAQPLAGLLLLALGGLLLGEAWGAARGGDMRQSLYQLQQLAIGPMLALQL